MRSATRLPAVFLLVCLAAGCGGGGGGGSGPGSRAVSGGDLGLSWVDSQTGAPSSLVSVSFFVTDSAGSPVPGLQAGDFQILEDDAANSFFESSKRVLREPQDFAVYTLLLLDLSDSIRLSGALPSLVEAAKALADGIFATEGGEFHRMGIFWFDGSESIHSVLADGRFSADHAEIIDALDNLPRSFDPSTNLYGAIVEGLELLDVTLHGAPETIRRGNFVLFTDGSDNAGRMTKAAALRACDRFVHRPGREDGKVIESMTIGLGGEIDRQVLADIGKTKAIFAPFVSSLVRSFDDVAGRINAIANSYYRLEYCSPKRAGKHRLTIRATHEASEGFLRTEFDATGFTATCDIDLVEFVVEAISGPGDDAASTVAISASGARFLAGTFTDRIRLDGDLDSNGPSAGFVAEVGPGVVSGTVLWRRAYTAPSTTVRIRNMALTGAAERPTICGMINGSRTALGVEGVTSVDSGFVTRLDSDGDPLWTRVMTGNGSAEALDIEAVRFADTDSGALVQRVAVCGVFRGSVTFESGPSSRTLVSDADGDGFVALYSDDGILLWVVDVSSAATDRVTAIVAESDGGILSTGEVGAAVTTGDSTLASPVYPTAFVARLNRAGTRPWIHALSDPSSPFGIITGSSSGSSIAVDTDGDVFVSGSFIGEVDCAGDTGPIADDPPAANRDAFVAKFGTAPWCRGLGGPRDDDASRLAVDSNGDVTVAGVFRGTASLAGPNFTAASTPGSATPLDVFALRLSGFDGRHLFAYVFGSVNDDHALGLAIGMDDTTHVVGSFLGVASFIEEEIIADGPDTDGFVLVIR